MPTNLPVDSGYVAKSLNENIDRQQTVGYAVRRGIGGECAVSLNSGTLGETNTLSVAGGRILFNGAEVSVTGGPVGLDAASNDPRWDVVYLDGTGAAQVAKGNPAPAEPNDTSYAKLKQPVVPSLFGVDGVPLAAVFVPANNTTITTQHIVDKRAFDPPWVARSTLLTPTTVTGNHTPEDLDWVLADASTAALTVTLPPPSTDLYVKVKKIDSSANAVTIATPGTETIDGQSSLTLSSQYVARDIGSDGTNYFIG